MRLENAVKNSSFAIVKFATTTIIKFIVRSIFIYVLGEAYVGINGLFSSVLSVLSLAELGFGSAVVYSMFKPVAEGDKETVSALMNFYKKVYLTIAAVVLVVGLSIMPLLNLVVDIKSYSDLGVNLYIVYALFVINNAVSYTLSYKRSLLYAYQRNDIESFLGMIVQVLYAAAQIVVLLVTRNFLIYTILLPISTFVENLVITLKVNKLFPDIKCKGKISPQILKTIKKNVFSLIFHKVGAIIVFSTDNILLMLFVGATLTGRYSNYYLVISSVSSILSMIIMAIGSSIGNSIAAESKEQNLKTFKKLSYIYFFAVTFCTACLFALLQPFVKIWLGEGLMFPILTVLLMCVSFYVTASRSLVNQFKEKCGLYFNDIYKPLLESVVNLLASIGLAIWLSKTNIFGGVNGVIIGTIISSLFLAVPIEVCVLYKAYFKQSPVKYFLGYIGYAVVAVVMAAACYFAVTYLPSNIGFFILSVIISVVIAFVLFIIFTFKNKEFKNFCSVIKDVLNIVKGKIKNILGKDKANQAIQYDENTEEAQLPTDLNRDDEEEKKL